MTSHITQAQNQKIFCCNLTNMKSAYNIFHINNVLKVKELFDLKMKAKQSGNPPCWKFVSKYQLINPFDNTKNYCQIVVRWAVGSD